MLGFAFGILFKFIGGILLSSIYIIIILLVIGIPIYIAGILTSFISISGHIFFLLLFFITIYYYLKYIKKLLSPTNIKLF